VGHKTHADSPDEAGNAALRTHFQQLTEKMLVPLNRYFQTLVPNLSPDPSAPTAGIGGIKPFSIPAFLTHLKTKGPNPLTFRNKGLTTRTRVENDFYTSFCMSPTFAGWLASRVDSLGLAVAAQSNTLSVPPPRHHLGRGPVGGNKSAGGSAVGLGIIETPSFADLSISDTSSMTGSLRNFGRMGGAGSVGTGETGRTSPSQWSSEGDPRLSSDGSSLGRGQWTDEAVSGARWR